MQVKQAIDRIVNLLNELSSRVRTLETKELARYEEEKTWDPAVLADGAVDSTTVTIAGVTINDIAIASLTTIGANDVLISAHIEAADTVRVVVLNKSGGILDIGSGTLRVYVWT